MGVCMNSNIIKKANDVVKASTEAYVSIIESDGFPHVATRSVIKPINILSCFLAQVQVGI